MISRIKYWSVYTIFRWQFILLALGVYGTYEWLSHNVKDVGSVKWDGVAEWLKILFFALLGLIAFSLLMLLISWIVFAMGMRSGRTKVSLHIPGNKTPEAGVIPVEAVISNVLRPLLGAIELRVVFPDWKISDRIVLSDNKRSWLLPYNTVSGTAMLDLHDRGLHKVEEVQVVLTDMLKLVSIPLTMHAEHKLLTLPRELKEEQFQISPTATEEQDVRIPLPKRVQGEFLSYKDFESGDDIRRIVWKIYAKSGDLVVRIPETRDPYASHVYVCFSFFNSVISALDNLAGRELLNVYKDYLRQVYDAVKRNQYSIRIVRDQEADLETESDVSSDLFFMATAQWQDTQAPSEIFDTPKAAVICLSSATDAEEADKLFSKLPVTVPVIVFGLSSALGPPFRFSVKRLFFRDRPHPLNEVRRSWWISPLRKRLKLNEQKLESMVRQRGNAWFMRLSDK